MSPTMMSEATVAEVMKPLPDPISLGSTAAVARQRMREDSSGFLPVVSPDNGKLLGIVLQSAVERACIANGHDAGECTVSQHLKTDIDFCFLHEPVDEVRGKSSDAEHMDERGVGARRQRARLSLPVIVVDAHKIPVGVLPR